MAEKRRRRQARRSPQQQARRDVGLVIKPQLRELRQQKRQLRGEYGDYDAKMGSLYGILDKTLGGIGTAGQQAFGGVQDRYSEGAEGILAALGQSTAPDQAGFLNTLGTQALAGQNQLSTDASREAAFNASTRRQGGLERMQLGRNIRGELQDAFDEIRGARRGIMSDRGPLLTQRLDQLRQMAFDRQMALKELALRRAAVAQANGDDAAMAGFIRDYGHNALSNAGGPNRRRRRRRRGGGGGSAVVPPGTGDKRRQ